MDCNACACPSNIFSQRDKSLVFNDSMLVLNSSMTVEMSCSPNILPYSLTTDAALTLGCKATLAECVCFSVRFISAELSANFLMIVISN